MSNLIEDPRGLRFRVEETPSPTRDSAATEKATVTEVQKSTMGRVVVGIDGSEASVGALRRGMQVAGAFGASLEVISAWTLPTGYGNFASDWDPQREAQTELDETMAQIFGEQRPSWVSCRIHQGSASQILIEASEGAEMLIVGSRGHGGLAGMLLGSVSSACAEHAHCPVLIMH